MDHQNILFHRLTEEWKSTDIDPSRLISPEESPSSKTDNGNKRQDTSPKQWLCDIPMQFGPQEKQQTTQTFASCNISQQQRSQNIPPLPQVFQAIPLPQRLHNVPSQETLQTRPQQRSQIVPSQQHLQDSVRHGALESSSFVDRPNNSRCTLKRADIPNHMSSDYKTQLKEIITVPKKEADDLQSLVMHLRNQLAQKDREIDALQRRADTQKPEISCLKEKYSNLQQSFATVRNQLDTTKAMCLSLEKSIAEETKERELLKEQCEEQNQTVKNLQTKLQKKTSEVASLENALNIEESRKTTQEENEAIVKYNAREEMARRFKEDIEKQEELLQLERKKNLETVNRMQLTKSMFEEQKKTLQAENIQLQQLCDRMNISAQEMMNTIELQQQQLAKKNDELIGMEKEMLGIRMRNEEIACNYQKMIANLKMDLLQKNNQYDELKEKFEEAGALSNDLQEKLSEASTKIQKLKDENTMLQGRLKKINSEIQKEKLQKQDNEEKLIEAKQMMTSLKGKIDNLNLSHSKEINLLKQTISDLENIIARKDDIIAEQQEEMRKIKCYVCSLESEVANINEQARLERERHNTLCEKADLLSEFLDKSSETLTEKQQQIWALKQQLEANKRLSTVVEENANQETSGIATNLKNESERYGSSETTDERISFYSIEDLREELKFKDQCLRELTNTVIKMGLEARQKEVELQQEILQLKNVINKKEAMLSYQEKMLAQAQYDLSINKAILKEADITVHQKEIELEKEKQKAKEATMDKNNEEFEKTETVVQDPLLPSTIEKSKSADEVDSTDSHGSCLIYETEICLLKDLHKAAKGSRKGPATSTPRKTQSRNNAVTFAPSKIQTDSATKIIKVPEKLGENPPQPPPSGTAETDPHKPAEPTHYS